MRTACLALFVATICLSAASAQQWRTQPIMQKLHRPQMIKDMAVSPSGKQIAWVSAGGLLIHTLRDSGSIGDLHKRIELPDLYKVVFTPSGLQIICADTNGNVHMIDRSTWNVRTANASYGGADRGEHPVGIAVVAERPEVYVSYWRSAYVVVFDYNKASVVGNNRSCMSDGWFQVDVVIGPGAGSIVAVTSSRTPEGPAKGLFTNHPAPAFSQLDYEPNWEIFCEEVPIAVCAGPDPEHLLVLREHPEAPLCAMQFSDGRFTCPMDFDLKRPVAVVNSNDGRFIVVADADGQFVKIISGADVRGLIDPDFVIGIADVRTYTVGLGEQPIDVTLHPDKDVAYTWSDRENCIWVVRLGLPGV